MPQSVICSSKHTENKSITPSDPFFFETGKSPDITEQPDLETGQELNFEHAQIRTRLDRQREQILAGCQAEIRRHEFQSNYDQTSVQKLSETIESQQEELHRRDQQLLHEQLLKQNWGLREAHEKVSM